VNLLTAIIWTIWVSGLTGWHLVWGGGIAGGHRIRSSSLTIKQPSWRIDKILEDQSIQATKGEVRTSYYFVRCSCGETLYKKTLTAFVPGEAASIRVAKTLDELADLARDAH
jgi:hypothetical protein